MRKTMKRLTAGATRLLVLALGLGLGATAWADFERVNPVTGETETYANTFTGGTTEWNSADNWDTSTTPFITSTYTPALVNGGTASTSTPIDGWTLRVGAYNGAEVTWSGGITKIQAGSVGCWLTADETSSITIASFAGNQLEGSDSYPFKLSSANAGGITWSAGLTSAGNTTLPFWYYLKGTGTVVYGGDITVANAQVIKQADITLTGTSQVSAKTLITFGSGTTKTFGADATIKRFTSIGGDLEDLNDDAHLAEVKTTGATTLTTSDAVGKCELVQTSTGVVLYWVDGDPEALTPTVYKPSISVNFTSGTSLSTLADVGIGGYAIPGTSWNNLIGNNGSLTTVTGVDSTGTSSTISGAKVTISGTRGYHYNNGVPAVSDLRNGYIDDNDASPSPQFVVEGIPYYSYKTILYFASDSNATKFGYVTVNGVNYKGDLENTTTVASEGGSDIWGSASLTAFTDGGNYLVIPTQINTDGTLTVVSHRLAGSRAGLAAVQIVEVRPEAGENDLIIEVSGDTTYTVSEAKTLSGTVYVIGQGTLTLAGSAKISSATIDVSYGVTMNVNADRLDGTTYTGSGTVVYDGVVPPTGKGWTDSTWTGTVWIKNKSGITGNSNATTGVQPNSLGNSLSRVKFSGVNGWIEAPVEYNPEIVLENAEYDYALQLTDGNSPNTQSEANNNRATIIKKLSGSGTLCCGGTSTAVPTLKVYDASGFAGSIDTTNANATKAGLVVVFCDEDTTFSDTLVSMFITPGLKRTIYVALGKEVTLYSAATWTAETGFIVNGTLVADGTLASSHTTKAVSGSGKVVFTGRGSTVSGDAWWKNEAWTGTVTVKSVTNLRGSSGTGTYIVFNDCGNVGSVIELDTVSGWINPGYVCTVPLKITGTLSLTDGHSDKANAFKVGTLLGSGSISGSGSAPRVVFNVTTDWSGFTGTIGLNNKCVVFGETIPDTITAGQIYVSEGAVVTNVNSTASGWWAVGGIKVDGELCSPNLTRFGGGTAITTGDDGVFTLITSSNVDDNATDYARIQGTGTLKLASDGNYYRCVSKVNFPTNMTVQTELEGGFLLKENGQTYTVGSLAGSGYIRSDWNNGNRNMRILQAKDTTYSGVFDANIDRIGTVTVAPGVSSTGSLTLSGTQTASNDLTVESGAAVNLTGTWVGATTVMGTIGGTGTLTGALTFNAGSTFKAFGTNENGLSVSGAISYPASGTVTVDVSELTLPASGTTLMTFTTPPSAGDVASKMTVDGAVLKLEGGALKAYPVIQVSNVEFEYLNDYATAKVTATVSDPAATYKIRVGANEYTGEVNGTTVTFTGVATGHSSAYDNVNYTITATDAESLDIDVFGGSGERKVADVVVAGWINERAASSTGTSSSASDAGGAWTNAVTYTDGVATIADNRFEAASKSTNSCVTIEFSDVCFTATNDENLDDTAQAAIKLDEVDSVTTFKVLTNGNEWAAVSAAGFAPSPAATYKVVVTFNYANKTYGVSVDNHVLTNSAGFASFPLAASNATGVKDIDFAGSGTLTSMKGDQLEGYMVKDGQNHYYATIQEATQAYNSANGPYTVLHNGTPPAGWKIDEATKTLLKIAKGLFFMAY